MPATIQKLKASRAGELVWATETLEAYSIMKRADYPAGSTVPVFSDINIRTKAARDACCDLARVERCGGWDQDDC